MPIRRHAGVSLPSNVFRVRKTFKDYYYYQERRGRPDHGPLIALPYDPQHPSFWQRIEEIKRGTSGPAAGSFDALIALYKTQARYNKLAASSREVYDICLAKISAAWGPLSVRDLLPKHIYALMEKNADRPSMANMVTTVLRVLLREGIKHDYATVNVAREIEMLEEAGIGAEPWSEEIFAFVLREAPDLIMRAAVLGRATGQRAVDLVKIRPVDRRENGIRLLVQKIGNERHWVPLTAEAIQVIDNWPGDRMVPYLNLGGHALDEDKLRREWSTFRASHLLNVPDDATLHDLRAAAVCDRRIAGVPHQQIAEQLCMSLGMVIRYSKHIDRRRNAEAGMRVLERDENADLKTMYRAIENRKS